MVRKSALLIVVCLLASGCQKKEGATTQPEAQNGAASPSAQQTARSNSIETTLLQVAQAKPSVAERKFCNLVTFTNEPKKVPEANYLVEGSPSQAATEAGFFTVTGLGSGTVKLTPTEKYLTLWKEAQPQVDKFDIYSTWCFGKAKLTSLQNLKQAAPDKFLASGVMTLDPLPWATPEVVKLFGPNRNAGPYAPSSLVFYKSGDTWEVEKR